MASILAATVLDTTRSPTEATETANKARVSQVVHINDGDHEAIREYKLETLVKMGEAS
jgi:hypothetical protein